MFSVMGDFICPPDIHHYTSDLPLMPKRATVDKAWLSDKQKELNATCWTKHNSKQEYFCKHNSISTTTLFMGSSWSFIWSRES